MSFVAADSPGREGLTNTWLTPLALIRALGDFDLDPCEFSGHQTAKRLIVLPEDGLKAEWHGRVWLNPPYGRSVGMWLDRLADHGNGIALVFARTGTSWFQRSAGKADAIRFISGRIQFLNPNRTQTTNGGTASCLMAFGLDNALALEAVPGVTGVF